jgi:hypothetical protein
MTVQLTIPRALIARSSPGIGRGIAVKLAECSIPRIAVNYVK